MARNTPKQPLYFTFGNHMHWVDMQWLWGYHVLPGSVRDMLHLIKETGAKGNVNFDGIGYEKMAAECPEALAELRAAVKRGDVEPVGGSYGQPYGLFQGGESNIRQFTYGVRTARRLLGARPRSFWEEEFYFFPQLPQILDQCGYTGACLYFQWTWHTPEVPKEPTSLILWEGIDGTRLPCLPRNDLNLHQWPEDFDGVLDKVAAMPDGGAPPAIVQWLELMPSKDWMCRSEVLLPRLKELMGDKRFDVRPRTVSGLIKELTTPTRKRRSLPDIPVRHYTMDDVWHGMTLGKNGDHHPRNSHECETAIREAESLSAVASLFGRPYASWDVYPTWELEEAWRLLLAAQHHDNHECEGLCGFVGHQQMWSAHRMCGEVLGRAAWLLSRRTGAKWHALRGINCLGWSRRLRLTPLGAEPGRVVDAPAFGYTPHAAGVREPAPAKVQRRGDRLVMSRGSLRCTIDAKRGVLNSVEAGGHGSGGNCVLFDLLMGDTARRPTFSQTEVLHLPHQDACVHIKRRTQTGDVAIIKVSFARELDAVDVRIVAFDKNQNPLRPKAGLNASLQTVIRTGLSSFTTVADSPLAVHAVKGSGEVRRKYPEGDWMTSPQWFETVRDPFTASTFVDFIDAHTGAGLLVCHNGSQQWFRDADGARAVITAYDPWDEGRYTDDGTGASFRVIPHGGLTNSERVRYATEFRTPPPDLDWSDAQPVGGGTAAGVKADLPSTFGPLEVCDAPNVLAHAFFRESMKSGEHLPDWAGHRMFAESDGACDHPFVIRLVEWNGEPARVRLKLAGKVALAAKTNLMGEVATERRSDGATKGGGGEAPTQWLTVKHPVAPPWWGKIDGKLIKLRGKPGGVTWSEVEFDMRPREIATIYADMVMGRKEFRDLDAKRKVWATIHKVRARRASKDA